MVKEVRYSAFGVIEEDTNPALYMPIGFAGGLHDRDVGFVRFGYRDYDPKTSRFTAKDPLGYAAGEDDLYGYCFDDPVNGIDPEGLWTAGVDLSGSLSIPFFKRIEGGVGVHVDDDWNIAVAPHWDAGAGTDLSAGITGTISGTNADTVHDLEDDSIIFGANAAIPTPSGRWSAGAEWTHADDWEGAGATASWGVGKPGFGAYVSNPKTKVYSWNPKELLDKKKE